MAALASDWLRQFRLLLLIHLTEFNETYQDARSQHPLPSLCFSGRSEKQRWPSWPLIGWDIFDFSSETVERNSMKLDRKQDLNVLYQVCVFLADRKNKIAALASDWLRHFWLLLWNSWMKGSITVRRKAIPSILVNFSTFAFLLNFSIMKMKKTLKFWVSGPYFYNKYQ